MGGFHPTTPQRSFGFYNRFKFSTSLGQEIGVNDFYEELFKWWCLKAPKPGVISVKPEVVDLADSGDEAGDLSIIMDVKVKSDPYSFDCADACRETACLIDESRDYAIWAMGTLDEALNLESETEHLEHLEPEYPDLPDPLLLEAPTMSSEVPEHHQVESQTGTSVPPSVPEQPAVPPPEPVKGIHDLDQTMTVKEVADRIHQLKYLDQYRFFHNFSFRFRVKNIHFEPLLYL